MKVIIAGDADSFWVKEYIEQILEKTEHEIVLITKRNEEYKQLYESQGIQVHTLKERGRFADLVALFNLNQNIKQLEKKIDRCDIIHVQYLDRQMIISCKRIMKKAKKVIFTFWGSDLLRAPKYQLVFLFPFLRCANVITVMTNAMKQSFEKIYGKRFSNKIKVLDFGNSMYTAINQVAKQMDKGKCKEYWGIEENKIVIAIGYNAIPEQQHLAIMKELVKLPSNILKDIIFLFHFGYGKQTDAYLRELKEVLEQNSINYKVIERFLDKHEIAILRLSADVFVYGQMTDALSASVLEYVYAGSVLVKPRWLDYSPLLERSIHYIEYNTFGELSGILENIIDNNLLDDCMIEENRKKLYEMNSWESLRAGWRNLYQLEGY